MRTLQLRHFLFVGVAALAGCEPAKPPRELPAAGNLLAHVSDPAGAPVGAALFDGVGAFTDRRGVATGTLSPNSAGWTRLRADGYVTSWTKPLPTSFREKQLVLAKLTPVQLFADVAPMSTHALVVGNPKQPVAEVRVPLLGFMQPVTIAFALIRPQDLGPMAFAPQDRGTQLKLQRAFAIEASREESVMQPTNPIDVRLLHPARFGEPMLGTFSPELGQWQMDPAACARVDPQWVRCRFTHFSTQGLFGTEGPDSTGDRWADIVSRLWDPGSNAPPEDVANAAIDFASRHPDEAGKSALMTAAARATQAGRADLVNDLVDRGRTAVEDLIDIELHEEGCGHVTDMMHLMEQGIALAVSQTQLNQLNERIQKALMGCDVWVGWVHYTFHLGDFIMENEDIVYTEGDRWWTERHVVHVSRDDKGNFHGESTADVKFPNVVYRDDVDNDPTCGDDFVDMEAEGNPPTGRIRVLFEGQVAQGRWTVTKVSSEPLENMALRTRTHVHKWAEIDDVCQLVLSEDLWLPWTSSYTTQLHKGFLGPTPPSLGEMLSEGDRSPNPLGRGEQSISGFTTSAVVAQPGVWPFADVSIAWNFFQVTPAR